MFGPKESEVILKILNPLLILQTVDSQVRVKEENSGDSTDGHSHSFRVKFKRTDLEEYNINCAQPRTALEAIKSSKKYKKLKFTDENIVIQLGKEDRAFTVATHYPCSCISDDEYLILSLKNEKVEVIIDQHYKTVHSRDKYSVFYIDTVGGEKTKTKKLFISNELKQFKYLCVYGEKGMTVEEALKRDGRFIDLTNFTLSDNENPNVITECTQSVDNLDGKKFKIYNSHQRSERDTKPLLDVAQQRGTSVTAALENKDKNIEEIYKILREQCPKLKELMESRFPGDTYQKALELRKEDFGKIQQSFSEVHRVRELIKLGESVCKVVVGNVCEGTGFVLFDNFILTNAHILKDHVEGGKIKDGIEVYVLFNYEAPESHTVCYCFKLAQHICYSEDELDYAILEINPECHKSNQTTPTEQIELPPGLLKKFGPIPLNGEACIIGHPAGGVKKMDPTCIIEKEKRGEAVDDYLNPHRDYTFTLCSITHLIREQGIENIMMGGCNADKVVTYNTSMYHGSSGSPVFDAHGQVFGLHTAGYVYGFPKNEKSVIEFAQPLLTIFDHFVSELKKRGEKKLLKRVKKEAKGNSYLEKLLVFRLNESGCEEQRSIEGVKTEPADPDEHSGTNESMVTD
ncbi:serine protease FAM111A-like [Anoplopoma fimbria]|uniref:serine protease FAM111A-like n=1 Tax=Anoplopoma fimbria TaxID=229290 RepID=UPI0023EDE033|nr:serine protease FAM111A-like [Anoplopoma fimbria]